MGYISKSGLIAGILAAIVLQGCSSMVSERMFVSEDQGLMTLVADAPTIDALMEGLNGLVVTGKAAPNTADEFHELKKQQDRTRGQRWMLGRKPQQQQQQQQTQQGAK